VTPHLAWNGLERGPRGIPSHTVNRSSTRTISVQMRFMRVYKLCIYIIISSSHSLSLPISSSPYLSSSLTPLSLTSPSLPLFLSLPLSLPLLFPLSPSLFLSSESPFFPPTPSLSLYRLLFLTRPKK